MKKLRCTPTDIRNRKLTRRYAEIMHSHGDLARFIRKQTFYEQLAEEFDVNWQTAGRICREHIKNGERSSFD